MSATYRRLTVCLAAQTLIAHRDDGRTRVYPVSTAARGAGQRSGSYQTPLGRHTIRAKVGAGAPAGAVFVRRRATGEVWRAELHAQCPERDWILSRILWLRGEERGVNRGGDVDSLRRFIYIHGTPDFEPLGEARSHGCVRMSNADVIHLFDRVAVGTPVEIVERAPTFV